MMTLLKRRSVLVTLLSLLTISAALHAAESPAPTSETPQQRAARLLDEAGKRDSVHTQERRQAAGNAYQSGLRLMNDLQYEEAKYWFERALELEPGNPLAREKLHTVNSLLGVHTERVASKIRELENDAKMQAQESVLVIQNLIEAARRLEEKATILPPDAERFSRADILAEQLKSFQQAQEKLQRAKELINYLPPYVKYTGANLDGELKALRERLGR